MDTRQTLINAIEQLPEQQLTDVLQYVRRLADRQRSTATDPVTDPLAEFIGAVSHGSLAANLDSELYGS